MNHSSNNINATACNQPKGFWNGTAMPRLSNELLGLVLPTNKITGTKKGGEQSTLNKEAETLSTNLYDKVMNLLGRDNLRPERLLTSSKISVSAWLSQSRNTVLSTLSRVAHEESETN